jgi:cell division protein FtsB
MSGVKLQRTLDQWRNCDPKMMANAQSPAAVQFAIADAKRDISALAAANQRLEQEISKLNAAMSNRSARQFIGNDDQRYIDDLVAAGIRASDEERLRLEKEVAALRKDSELIQILKFARATMAVTAKSENLREVERRSLLDEVARIDAKLAGPQSCSPAE